MEPEVLAHAFEPFYTTKPPGMGTGLGLATVYGIVAQSGGCTYAQSKPGQGTTFTIYLPRVDAQADAQVNALPEPQKPELSLNASQPGKQTIMVVDSDATFLTLVTRILERREYEVLPLSDAGQAAAALADKTVSVDALVTDLTLSGNLQGDQLAALAAAKRPSLPVLFMSGQARDAMVEAGRVSQQATFLEKPFTAEELARKVRTCLSRL
jgi:two-component system cell cycle sensor histidine kinase/response regulator CckA